MAAKQKPPPSPDGAAGAEDFYAGVLTQADSLLMDRARRLEGLDEEVALLRVKLREALARCPEDYSLLLKLSAMLVRAASARYRLSTKAEEDLYQSVLGVLKGVGGVLFPEGREGSDGPA